jgi:hypothetical protein
MAHAQKPDFIFWRNRRVHLNRRGRQFSGLLAGELCTSACRVCTPRTSLCSAVMWRLLVTHSIRQFPLHFSSRSPPCVITFQLDSTKVDCVWNVMAHAQKPDFVFWRNRRVHLNQRGRQFSGLLAGELCTSACRVCIAHASLCSTVMWRLLVTHSICHFPLHFPSRASPCAITLQLDSTNPFCSHTTYKEWRLKCQTNPVNDEIDSTYSV